MRQHALLPIDPLTPQGGGYVDELVQVRRAGPRPPGFPGPDAPGLRPITRTPHFGLFQHGDRLVVEQYVSARELDEDLTRMLREELFDTGWVSGPELFERIFTGVVVSAAPCPIDAWEVFYRNTLNRIAEPGYAGDEGSVIAQHAPLYARAVDLIRGATVLDLGCCFGFLSLLLARRGLHVVAVDISPGTVALVRQVSSRLRLQVDAMTCDAARVPRADGAADTVVGIHLLEHLPAAHALEVVEEALRLARKRVVVAVPYEEVAEDLYGHLHTLTAEDLQEWGRGSRLPYRVEEFHGGWLVIDRQ